MKREGGGAAVAHGSWASAELGQRGPQERRPSWAGGEMALRAKNREEGRENNKLLFYFLKHIFKTNSNSNFNSL